MFVRSPLGADGQEKLLYVWTRDADGKDSDFLSVVDVDPGSATFGAIVATVPTNSAANEAHHFGYTAGADRIMAAGMFTNKLFLYDVTTDPRKPRLIKTVDLDPTGYSGPHTMYEVPNGVMLAMLGQVDGGGPGALVEVDDDGNFQRAWPVVGPGGKPGYMYDVGVKLEMNRMVTSSWAHPGHVKAGDHPQHSGKEVVVWDWKEKKILQVQETDPAPLEVRWMHGPRGLGGFTNAAFGTSIWHWDDKDRDGTLEFHRVIALPENSVPADMRVSYDNRYLYVSLWGGGKVQQYDISDPAKPVRPARGRPRVLTPCPPLRNAERGDPQRSKAEFAFAVFEDVIREVYRIEHWLKAGTTFAAQNGGKRRSRPGRWEFVGTLADETVRRRYVNRYVGKVFPRGARNPVQYVNV